MMAGGRGRGGDDWRHVLLWDTGQWPGSKVAAAHLRCHLQSQHLVRQSGTSAETNVGTLPFISFKVTSMNPDPEEGLPEDPEYTQSFQ